MYTYILYYEIKGAATPYIFILRGASVMQHYACCRPLHYLMHLFQLLLIDCNNI